MKKTFDISQWRSMPLRKRAAFLGGCIVVLSGVVYFTLIGPALSSQERRMQDKANWVQEIADAKQRLVSAQVKATAASGGISVEVLKNQIEERKIIIDVAVNARSTMSDRQIVMTVKEVAKAYPKVELTQVEAQDPQSVSLGEGATQVSVEQHDVVIKAQGSYLELMAYMKGLEKALPNMRWSELMVEQRRDFSGTSLSVKVSHVELASDFLKGR